MLFESQPGENLENGQTPSWCGFVQKKYCLRHFLVVGR